MKLFTFTLLTVFACAAHAQQTEPLPTPGDSAPLPAIDKPVQDTKEFNQDIDDFEKKISKEVPSEKNGSPSDVPKPSHDKAAEKARAQMKKQLSESGEPKSAMAKHKEAAAASRKASKKSGKVSKKSAAKKAKKKK